MKLLQQGRGLKMKLLQQRRGLKMKLLQQGDVLLKSCTAIPQDAKPIMATNRGYILALGEATGHAHRLEDIENVEMLEKDGKFFIRIKQPAMLVHEEHKSIMVDPGMWEVGKVMEYDHFLEEARNVID